MAIPDDAAASETVRRLVPNLDEVSQEYVLVQAWKKTSAYIRYHNWFSDTLELDRAAADLPNFIARLSRRLRTGRYQTADLMLVPAPKSQQWHVGDDGIWQPRGSGKTKLRPLAHVALADQVAATALLLCLGDRVESAQGDPRGDLRSEEARRAVASYGNRLFCDVAEDGNGLVHRWGSSKLYRAYFQDYRSFLQRPETVASGLDGDHRTLIIQTDLSQFYDRVAPETLHEKVRRLQAPGDDEAFFRLAEDVLRWSWSGRDAQTIDRYRRTSDIPDFDGVALPQGLVASGFFSNVVLLEFDEAVLSSMGREIAPGIHLHDACRYVDDIRLTVTTAATVEQPLAQERVVGWLERILSRTGMDLPISSEKTSTASVSGEQTPLVRQSRKMERIQAAISGGFDMAGGEEIIQSIEALVRSQSAFGEANARSSPAGLRAVPDVKDETIGRFAAGRFRTTFRSLRPLLDDRPYPEPADAGVENAARSQLSQSELDEEAHAFSLALIERWIGDPSNVRLLRVALDLWPSAQVLGEVLGLLEPYLGDSTRHIAHRRIAWYCLSEILRAGATETGFVDDAERLPSAVDLAKYRALLLGTAIRVVAGKVPAAPWYLVQQALLYVAVHRPNAVREVRPSRTSESYQQLLDFLVGNHDALSNREFAVTAIVCRRSFLDGDESINLVSHALDSGRFNAVARRDPGFARELFEAVGDLIVVGRGVADDIGVSDRDDAPDLRSLRSLVEDEGPLNILRSEIGVLEFSAAFLDQVAARAVPEVVTPSTIQVSLDEIAGYPHVDRIVFRTRRVSRNYTSIYAAPSWAPSSQRWRFQLGYLLRFVLSAQVDFGLPVRPVSWKEAQPVYRPTRAHWLQRQYGFHNGHEAFGDDWLPISQRTEDLLFALLAWPGCRTRGTPGDELSLDAARTMVRNALKIARSELGSSTGLPMIGVAAPVPGPRRKGRPLRVCVVQSIMPEEVDFSPLDLEMNAAQLRRKHRRHLSTALAAVSKMLDLRETHKPAAKRLDWLILPELSVHPDDVATHLVPFVRRYKTIVLAGMTYERVVSGMPLINSALWIIPRLMPGMGLEILRRRQGKHHLSPMETPFNAPVQQIVGFRPCQWLIGYEWSPDFHDAPLWLTGSVCYDATDLKLASDLRNRSDVFAIPALNKDVGTFDQMAQALHYHMFQLVLIANNGTFGGSNAHMPKGGPHQRQIFHTHGQPQATISFIEIEDIQDIKERHQRGLAKQGEWKHSSLRLLRQGTGSRRSGAVSIMMIAAR